MFKGYFDGGSVGKPALGAIGAYLMDSNNKVVWKTSKLIGCKTSIEAEYEALLALLHEISYRGIKRVTIYGDSEVVINQVSSSHKVRQFSSSFRLCAEAQKLLSNRDISFTWIPREMNFRADNLCHQAYNTVSLQISFVPLTEFIYLALGKEQYAVDLYHNSCTCSDYKNNGTCAHLEAAIIEYRGNSKTA